MKILNKITILFLTAISLFTSCSKKNQITPAIEIIENQKKKNDIMNTLTVAFTTDIDDPRGQACLLFKKIVEEKTNNELLINISPDGLLGSDSELIQKVINGSLDMTVSSAGNYGIYVVKAGISAMPFLFSDFENAWEFMNSSTMKQVDKSFEEYNMKVLSYFDNGFRCVTTSNRKIQNVSDMKDLIIRTPQNQIVMETMSQLGADPRPYSFTQLKNALKTGLFDAQENPIPIIYNSKLYQEQKYLAITNHSYDAMPLTINIQTWEKLSDDYKQIVLDAAIEAQNYNRQLIKNQTINYTSKLQNEGMIITYPNLKDFATATSDVIDVFAPVYGKDLVTAVKQLQ